MATKIVREAIVLHTPTHLFGRITSIDSDGNCSFVTNPHRGAPRQVKANVIDCVFIAFTWGQAWERLAAAGICDPRCGFVEADTAISVVYPHLSKKWRRNA